MEKMIVNGITYLLTTDAHIDGVRGGEYYEAPAIREPDRRACMVRWEIREGIDIDTLEDQSEACDWSAPASVREV